MNVFTFDIETIPNVALGRKLYDLAEGDDLTVAQTMFDKQREHSGSDFLPLYQHRIVAISAILKTPDIFKVWSLGDIESTEDEIIRRFFAGIDKYTPLLVSWNGSGFDLPVLHYRALAHGIASPRYWETGDDDQAFRWNNYLNRYHTRHTDVMDVLAGYQPRATAPLDKISVMLGLPGKMGMDGSKVWENYCAGHLDQIRAYCETDVLNTYLVYLRFCLIQGKLTEQNYQKQCEEVRAFLASAKQTHFSTFLKNWCQAAECLT